MSVNEKMTAIADRIRLYTGGTKKITLDDMPEEIGMVNISGYNNGFTEGRESAYLIGYEEGKAQGIEVGKQAERDAFWDEFQNGSYYYAFSYGKFSDENYNPIRDIVVANGSTTGRYMFYNATGITDTKVSIYATGTSANLQNSFAGCPNLKYIRKLVVAAHTTFSNAFNNAEALEMLMLEGTIGQNGFDVHWSAFLNKASIESIINALSTTTSGLTVTLSQTAVNNAFTAEEWDALEATKTNWTISLV